MLSSSSSWTRSSPSLSAAGKPLNKLFSFLKVAYSELYSVLTKVEKISNLLVTGFAPTWEDTTLRQMRRTETRKNGSNFALNNLHQRDGDGRHDQSLGDAHEKEVDIVELKK